MRKIKIGSSYGYLEYYLQDTTSPTMIICPGGAYFYTSVRESKPVADSFFKKGYNVFVLHYSTMANKIITETNSTYEQAKDEVEDIIKNSSEQPAKFPQPLIELALSIKYLRDNAETYNVDVHQIITLGFSAGAHLVSMLGVYWTSSWLNDLVGTTKDELKVTAQILSYGYMDSWSLNHDSDGDESLNETMSQAVLGKKDPSENELKTLSPALLVHSEVPPSFIWHTRDDALIPVRQSVEFSMALDEKNIPWELHVFNKGGHGLSIATETSDSENVHVHHWVTLVESWLKNYYIKEG